MNALNGISANIVNVNNQIKPKKEVPHTETEQTSYAAENLSGENWRANSGISVENPLDKANKLINKFALTGKLGIRDITGLKKIVKSGNEQAENVAMLLSLVNEKTVNPKTLKYICKDGIMSDGMEKDIRMIFDAKKQGINPEDAYIPHFETSEEALKNAQTGDLFEVEGEEKIFIKNKDGEAEQLKMNKEMMLKLFPPAERFANAQTNSSDCYFVSAVNSMMDSPEARAHFLQCFEQDGDDVKIIFPSTGYTYIAENAEMPKVYKKNFVTGSTGMKLVEYAYGKFLEDKIVNSATEKQTKQIEQLKEQELSATDSKEKKEIQEKIQNCETVLERLTEDVKSGKNEYVVELDTDRQPITRENEGISLRSLNQMNMYRKTSFETAGDYYRGDGGFMEDVFKDFGYEETKAYNMEDEEIQEILQNPELSKDFIFSGGTKREGHANLFRAELVMDRSLSMYGAHAYRISPSQDNEGNVFYKVSNPWNSSHNAILTMEQLKQFFTEIHIAKIQ